MAAGCWLMPHKSASATSCILWLILSRLFVLYRCCADTQTFSEAQPKYVEPWAKQSIAAMLE